MRRHQLAGLLGAVVVVALLWTLPPLLFPNPGANDAPILWTAPIPVVGLTLLACLAAVVVDRAKARPATTSVALGTYLLGVAVAFLVGLMTFANLSDDRYWPFLLSPVLFAPAGIVLLMIGLVGRAIEGSEVSRGLAIGVCATVFLVAWMLARGSRDWLVAPYGFDVALLILLEAAVAFLIGRWWIVPRMVAPG